MSAPKVAHQAANTTATSDVVPVRKKKSKKFSPWGVVAWIVGNGDGPTVLLRADIEDAAEADHIFSTLMGEKVEPRRDFIKARARQVQNLDV